MRKFIEYLLCLASFVAVVSCDKTGEDYGCPEITFSAVLPEYVKAPGLYEPGTLDNLGQFNVYGYDGINKVIDNRIVYKNSDLWRFKENPIVWQNEHTMTFYAYANKPDWINFTVSSSTSASLAISSIPTSSADQCDPMFGYYSGKGNNGQADVVFNHPLTAVTFKTGTLGEPQYISRINSVTMDGVYNAGTTTVTGNNSGCTYSWTPTGSKSVSGDFNETQIANPFIIIPQNVASKNITLSVNVSLVSGGTDTMTIHLNTGNWQAGYHYTYTLDYVLYAPMVGNLTVTLTDWTYIKSSSGKDYFDADFDNEENNE